jgi:hypothetical protein
VNRVLSCDNFVLDLSHEYHESMYFSSMLEGFSERVAAYIINATNEVFQQYWEMCSVNIFHPDTSIFE